MILSESKHCPVYSDCRTLIATPLPQCQTDIMLKLFDDRCESILVKCHCCFCCIRKHSEDGCRSCIEFLNNFFPPISKLKLRNSVSSELKAALRELFTAMEVSSIKVEEKLDLNVASFIVDFVRVLDEIREPNDIVKLWHVSYETAKKIFSIFNAVTNTQFDEDPCDFDSESSKDEFDDSSSEADL